MGFSRPQFFNSKWGGGGWVYEFYAPSDPNISSACDFTEYMLPT